MSVPVKPVPVISVHVQPLPASSSAVGWRVVAFTDGEPYRMFIYRRPFAVPDFAHAEYFKRLVETRGAVEPDHWDEVIPPDRKPAAAVPDHK